ncbi:hypothetical protein [Bergeyella sp. RCAD1439]|uniref:hypothetical protein n=1 Tax=Bergeyella anatis TaxID=3113737 RepID=UPI002E19CEC7|nr:hypothetical protein [Bergeyella sp. RCAD1439]
MKIVFLTIIFLFFSSCSIQKNEYLEFETSNAIVIGSKTNIRLVPTYRKYKKNVKVEIFRHNEYLDSRKITTEKYNEILNLFSQISEKDSTKINWIDSPSIKINFKKKDSLRRFYYIGIPQKEEKLYELTNLILGTAKLKIQDID